VPWHRILGIGQKAGFSGAAGRTGVRFKRGERRLEQIEAHVEAALAELEAALGHGFARPELLVRALTHRSLANEQARSVSGTAR
jgi:hypothetical protein